MLPHAAAQLIGIMVLEAGQSDQADVAIEPLGNHGGRRAGDLQAESDVVENGFPGQQAKMLKDDGDAFAGAMHGLTVDQNLTGAWRQKTADAAQQRCLATTRRTDDTENFLASNLEINVAKGDDRAFKKQLAGVIHDDLGSVRHRKGQFAIEPRSPQVPLAYLGSAKGETQNRTSRSVMQFNYRNRHTANIPLPRLKGLPAGWMVSPGG